MSLEAALEANTAVLTRVAELLDESNKTREAALAKMAPMVEGEASPGPGRPRGRPKAEPKTAPVAENDFPRPVSDLIETVLAPAKEEQKAPEYPDVQALRDAAVKFNGVDGEEKTRRKDFMKAVMDELGIAENAEGKRVIVNAAPEDRQKVIDWFAAFAAGEKVSFMADDAPASDEDDIG